MLVKWITCQVRENEKAAFSKAQEQWEILKDCEGFIGQFGGWNMNQSREACIVGIWGSLQAYQSFMNNFHDQIVEKNEQNTTYEKIDVKLFEVEERLQIKKITGIAEIRDCFSLPIVSIPDEVLQTRLQIEPTWTVEGVS